MRASTSEIAELETQIQQNTQTKSHLDKLCKDLRTAVYEVNTEKMQINSKLAVYERDIKRLKDEEPLIASEMGTLEAQIAQSVQKEYDSKQRLTELEAVNNERAAHIKELEGRYDELQGQQQDRMQDLTDLKVRLGQVLEQQKGLRQIIERLQGQMQASLRTLAAAEEEIRVGAGQLAEAQRDILECEARVSELFVEKENAQHEQPAVAGRARGTRRRAAAERGDCSRPSGPRRPRSSTRSARSAWSWASWRCVSRTWSRA